MLWISPWESSTHFPDTIYFYSIVLALHSISTSESTANPNSYVPLFSCACPHDFCQQVLLTPSPNIKNMTLDLWSMLDFQCALHYNSNESFWFKRAFLLWCPRLETLKKCISKQPGMTVSKTFWYEVEKLAKMLKHQPRGPNIVDSTPSSGYAIRNCRKPNPFLLRYWDIELLSRRSRAE